MPACERCETTIGVEERQCYTAYEPKALSAWEFLLVEDEGLGESPELNVCPWLCPACAKRDKEFWDEMWDEYNRSRI